VCVGISRKEFKVLFLSSLFVAGVLHIFIGLRVFSLSEDGRRMGYRWTAAESLKNIERYIRRGGGVEKEKNEKRNSISLTRYFLPASRVFNAIKIIQVEKSLRSAP
jgi:hypothetical protein